MAYDDYAQQVERMKQRREMARLLAQQGGGDRINSVGGVVVPYTMGEGFAKLGQALISNLANQRLDREESELRDQRKADVAAAYSGLQSAVPDEQVGSEALARILASPDDELPEPVTGRSEAVRNLALEMMPAEDLAKLEYKRQLGGGDGPQGVQSTVIGDDGFYYTVDRLSGEMANTGVRAAPNTRVIEQEGNTPFSVVTGRGQAGKIIPLGEAPSATPMRTPTAGERARDVATNTAAVDLATKPEIAKQTELAKTEAERSVALPGQLADVQKMRRNIEGLLSSPGFNTIYGLSRNMSPSMLPGGTGADADVMREQLDAQAFGEAIQKMRGLGALSNAEGQKVSAAYTRATNPKQSEESARVAWNEVLESLTLAEERLRAGVRVRDNDAQTAAPSAPAKPATPKRVKVDAQGNVIQ